MCRGKEIHLSLLYYFVHRRGGHSALTSQKLWARVRDDLAIDSKASSRSNSHVRKLYEHWLLPVDEWCEPNG
jgi:hypothetical protein